jgi:glycosyltransferase involved in cell wall biosynthesis
MRVAIVHGPGSPRYDGVSDYVAHLLDALAGVGVDAVGVPVRPPAPDRWLAAVVRAGEQIRLLRPALVHVQFAPSAFRFSAAPGLIPRLLRPRLPLVTTIHEYGWWAAPAWVPPVAWQPLEALRVWDRETGRLVLDSTAVLVTNRSHGALVRRRTGATPTEIPLAPNVEVASVDAGVRSRVRYRLGLDPNAFLLVFFGFVHPVKGIRYLLEALPEVRAQEPSLHLVVLGGFTSQALPEHEAAAFRSQLETHAAECGVSDAVTFTGHLAAAQASEILQAADAAVLPFTAGVTLKSGALLAVAAHGLPAAVTVPDGLDPQLRDGENVAVIPARRDAGAVAATLKRLVGDTGLRRRIAAGGAALAAGRSWPDVAAAHRLAYEKVLSRG